MFVEQREARLTKRFLHHHQISLRKFLEGFKEVPECFMKVLRVCQEKCLAVVVVVGGGPEHV